MLYHTFRKFILFCMLINSWFLLAEEPQETSDRQVDAPVEEKLHKDLADSGLLELFGKHGQSLTESEFIRLVTQVLEEDAELTPFMADKLCKASFELLKQMLVENRVTVAEENAWSVLLFGVISACAHQVTDQLKKELLQEEKLDTVSSSIDHLDEITCVDSFEKNEAMGELLRSASSIVSILELLGVFGNATTDQQLEAWINRELEKNPEVGRCAVDTYGNTLVHITACREMLAITEKLLAEYKADVNALNGWGLAPIDMVVLCGEQKQASIERVLNSLLSNTQEQLEMPDLDEEQKNFELEENQANQTSLLGHSQPDTLHDEL